MIYNKDPNSNIGNYLGFQIKGSQEMPGLEFQTMKTLR